MTIQFTQHWPSTFDDDDVVIRHELGHALVALSYGFQIEHVRYIRTAARTLKGAARMRHPAGWDDKRLLAECPDMLVERVLAGEIAARIYLGLPTQVICTDLPVVPGSDLGQLLALVPVSNLDDVKALTFAHSSAGTDWYRWLSERHVATERLILQYWEVLDQASDVIHGDIPLWQYQELTVPGPQVKALLGFTDRAHVANVNRQGRDDLVENGRLNAVLGWIMRTLGRWGR